MSQYELLEDGKCVLETDDVSDIREALARAIFEKGVDPSYYQIVDSYGAVYHVELNILVVNDETDEVLL